MHELNPESEFNFLRGWRGITRPGVLKYTLQKSIFSERALSVLYVSAPTEGGLVGEYLLEENSLFALPPLKDRHLGDSMKSANSLSSSLMIPVL